MQEPEQPQQLPTRMTAPRLDIPPSASSPAPHSPTSMQSSPKRGRTLKGASIRSLRGLLQASLSSSSSSLIQKEAPAVTEAAAAGLPPQIDPAAAKKHADNVRSRLLHNLGIPPKQQPEATASNNNSAPPISMNAQQQQQPWGPSYTIPLNDAVENGATTTTTDDDATNKNNDENDDDSPSRIIRQKQLHFDPTVQVHPIPSFAVYSQRVRNTIWAGADELAENVARNSLEFCSEHWDADQVLDEDRMLYHNGEWIHPVHFANNDNDDDTKEVTMSSDELWRQTCERMGIQPAEYYHSIHDGPAQEVQ